MYCPDFCMLVECYAYKDNTKYTKEVYLYKFIAQDIPKVVDEVNT